MELQEVVKCSNTIATSKLREYGARNVLALQEVVCSNTIATVMEKMGNPQAVVQLLHNRKKETQFQNGKAPSGRGTVPPPI